MKLGTITIPAIALTVEEERALRKTYCAQPHALRKTYCAQSQLAAVNGHPIEHWLTQDGNDDILLRGETVYRAIVRPNSPNFKPD